MRFCRISLGTRVLLLSLFSLTLIFFTGRAVFLRDHHSRHSIGGDSGKSAFRNNKLTHGNSETVSNGRRLYWRGPSIQTHTLQFGVEFGDSDYDGWFEKGLFKATKGAYPVHIVTDAFWHCERGLHLISRDYKRTPAARNHSEIRAEIRDVNAPTGWRELTAEGWYVEKEYESSAVGIYKDESGLSKMNIGCASGVEGGVTNANDKEDSVVAIDVRISFAPARWQELYFEGVRTGATNQALPLPPPREANVTFSLNPLVKGQGSRIPQSRFAMCAIFSFNNYMLRMWADYWSLMGIGTFYFYYNGDPKDLPQLNETLAPLRAHVVWVEWPSLHWVDTDGGDITHGQPMAIVDCLERWRDEHEFFFFYDLDEVRGGGGADKFLSLSFFAMLR